MKKKELKNKKEDMRENMRGEALVIQWYQMPSTWPLFIGLHTLEHSAMVTRIKEVHID